jgi:MFS family permease
VYVTLRDQTGKDSTVPDGVARRVAPTVILLGIVSLLTDVSSEMVAAVLAPYLTAELGLGLLAYGFVDGLYQGVSALVRMTGGYLGDRGRHPKRIAVVGYGVSALAKIAMLPAAGFAAITAVISADRLGKGLRTAPRDGLIADASHPAVLGRAFGVHRTLDTIGAAIGPLVAFAILNLLVPGGYDSVFIISFAFAVIGVAVLVLFVPNRRTGGSGGATRLRFRDLARQMAGPRLRKPLLVAGVLGLVTVGDGFLYLSLQHRDSFAATWIPLLYVGTNVAYLLLAIPLGRLADRIGKAKVYVGGHVALLLVYAVAAGPWWGTGATIATVVLLGTFYAATDGVLPALVSRLAPAEARGTAIAAAQTAVVLARFGSSLAFGALWISLGRGEALWLVAGLLALAIPTAAVLLRGTERDTEVEPA